MADYYQAIPIILKHEGGFVHHKDDPGGATNRGITFNVFKRYAKSLLGIDPTMENLRNLSQDQAVRIYQRVYWDKIHGDEIKNQQIANILFDAHVNKGINGIKLIQQVLKVDDDGVLGPITLNAINNADPCILFNDYKTARINYYLELVRRKPALNVFLKGWLNRINSFQYVKP